MKRNLAIVAVILLVTLGAFFFLSPIAERKPVKRFSLLFAGFAASGAGHDAVFVLSNHPSHLSFRFAQIDQRESNGWVGLTSNVAIRPRPGPGGGVSLPVTTTNAPLRFVFHIQEGQRPRSLFFRLLKNRNKRSPYAETEPYFLTNYSVSDISQ